MKSNKRITFLVATFCFLFVASYRSVAQDRSVAEITKPGFAVLELFTSEGCSSCPPAEALLEQIDRSSVGRPVYVLAYHVDYWDRQGWKDAFSDHRFSTRQYLYSRLLPGQVYTPQLIINGVTEGIGSNVEFVNEGIHQALATPANTVLQINAKQVQRMAAIQYRIQGSLSGEKLLIAIVQKHAVSHVLRGENKGRILSHAAIVRDLQSFATDGRTNGTIMVQLPPDFNKKDWDIVSFLQNPATGRISAAGRAKII